MKRKLRLGTRKSLLAWSQSQWVAKQIQRFYPEIEIELCGIETRGDLVQNIALQKMEGKDFFVAEIDEALQSGKVDFTVHSMKDLSLDRPSGFQCFVPRRENPRDIVIFSPQIMHRMASGAPLKIGTSSPRRIENTPSFLARALPQGLSQKKNLSFEWTEIRGNIDTRLARVHEKEGSSRSIDAVVLAFSGLMRLWKNPQGRQRLEGLLKGVYWMLLPLKECPAAPAQGALAIESRREDRELQKILSSLHDFKTEQSVSQERELLQKWGGGCHQRFGATKEGDFFFIRGKNIHGQSIDALVCHSIASHASLPNEPIKAWDGSMLQPHFEKNPFFDWDLFFEKNKRRQALFIAHSRAVDSFFEKKEDLKMDKKVFFSQTRVWTSGVASWFRLAEKGVWVEGCAEGFGFDALIGTLSEAVLGLPPLQNWDILTHEGAEKHWQQKGMHVWTPYRVSYPTDEPLQRKLSDANCFFWSSVKQYHALKKWASEKAHHACGPGKTFDCLKQEGLNPSVFLSVSEWKKWLKI